MATKHSRDMEKLQSDQQAKVEADEARRAELREEMVDQNKWARISRIGSTSALWSRLAAQLESSNK